MAIYLTESFHLNSNQPFDIRTVVGSQSYYLTKDDIVTSGYIYSGLRIWDFNTGTIGTPYVWTGTEWSSENDIGALIPSPSGNQNYIVKFFDDTTSLSRSSMYDDGNSIGIGLTAASIQPGSLNGLHVLGNIKTNAKFVGDGSLLSSINANNITTGILDLDRIERISFIPGTTYVLTQLNSDVSWDVFNTNPVITLEDSSAVEHFINFTATANGSSEDVKGSTNLKYIPSTQQLLNGWGSSATPAYSFIGNSNKGMYWDNSGLISFTTGGSGIVSIFDGGVSISHSLYPQIGFYSTTTTKSRLLYVNNSNNLLFRFDSTIVDDKQVWHDSNLYHLRQVSLTSLETGRVSNGITTNGSGQSIGGIYNYNLLNDSVMNSSLASMYPVLDNTKKYWSNLIVGNGANGGSFQIAGNWVGASASNREMLVRGLDSSVTSWSEWSRVCLNENQSFRWSMGRTQSTREMLKVWMENNLPKTIRSGQFDPGGGDTTDTLVPYNPATASFGSTGNYDRFGSKPLFVQAWHNIPGYEVRYFVKGGGGGDTSVTIVMFKVTSGSNIFVTGLMREWSLYTHSTGSALVWTPQSLSGGGGGTFFSSLVAPTTINLSGAAHDAFVTLYSTRPGFSSVRLYVRENESVTQAMTMTLSLQQRTVDSAPI